MNNLDINKFRLQIKHSKRIDLNDVLKEIISYGEFPKELETEVIKLLKNGDYIISDILCDIIILTKSEELYNLGVERKILSDWDYIKLFGSGFKVEEIEEMLEELLFKIYKENDNYRRSLIVDNMGEVGGERSLNLINVILDELTTTLPVEKIKFSASYNEEEEKNDIVSLLQGLELKSLSEIVEKLKIAKQKIESRTSQNIKRRLGCNTDCNSQQIDTDANATISTDETKRIENKSSFLYCLKTKKQEDYVIKSCTKTIVTFLNTYGGELFVGVADDGTVLGLSNDYKLSGKGKDRDAFMLKMDSIITKQIGAGILANYIDISFHEKDGKDLVIVKVKRSENPVWLKGKGEEEFFIRVNCSTRQIKGEELSRYLSEHWVSK